LNESAMLSENYSDTAGPNAGPDQFHIFARSPVSPDKAEIGEICLKQNGGVGRAGGGVPSRKAIPAESS
jgi:hypothetical protein